MPGLEHELFISGHFHLQNEAAVMVCVGDAHCFVAR